MIPTLIAGTSRVAQSDYVSTSGLKPENCAC